MDRDTLDITYTISVCTVDLQDLDLQDLQIKIFITLIVMSDILHVTKFKSIFQNLSITVQSATPS